MNKVEQLRAVLASPGTEYFLECPKCRCRWVTEQHINDRQIGTVELGAIEWVLKIVEAAKAVVSAEANTRDTHLESSSTVMDACDALAALLEE